MEVKQPLSTLEAAGVKAKLDEILRALTDAYGTEPLTEVVQHARSEVDTPESTKSSIKENIVEAISIAGNLSSIAQTAPSVAPVLPILAQLISML